MVAVGAAVFAAFGNPKHSRPTSSEKAIARMALGHAGYCLAPRPGRIWAMGGAVRGVGLISEERLLN